MRRGTFVRMETVAVGFSYPPLARSLILDQLGHAMVWWPNVSTAAWARGR